MIFHDLREWLAAVEGFNELVRVCGASWEKEIGPITNLLQKEMEGPALLFDDIPGYPSGYRVLSNSCTSLKRIALTLNMPVDYKALDIIQHWRRFLREYKPLPPREVPDGPLMENCHQDGQVDLEEFPVPVWHEEDGGRYIGTGCIVVTRDPDSGWVNCGTYRIKVHDKQRAGLWIVQGKHGALARDKYWQRGEPMPVAVSVGHDPIHYLMGGMEIPYGVSEYEFVGAIRGEPVEVIKTPIYGLPVPATSEIVLEGESVSGKLLPEGPFGEWTGYYATGIHDAPFIQVKAIYHRHSPIILGASPSVPPSDINYYRSPIRSAMVWDQLEQAGVPGIQGVWAHPVGGARMLLVVALKQMYPGHARQAGLIASQCHAAAYVNKVVVIVDEDIDIFDTNKVLWAILTRVDPVIDIEVIRRCWTSRVDPTSYPEGSGIYNNRVIIDACRPWENRHNFPPTLEISPELEAIVVNKWPELFQK